MLWFKYFFETERVNEFLFYELRCRFFFHKSKLCDVQMRAYPLCVFARWYNWVNGSYLKCFNMTQRLMIFCHAAPLQIYGENTKKSSNNNNNNLEFKRWHGNALITVYYMYQPNSVGEACIFVMCSYTILSLKRLWLIHISFAFFLFCFNFKCASVNGLSQSNADVTLDLKCQQERINWKFEITIQNKGQLNKINRLPSFSPALFKLRDATI